VGIDLIAVESVAESVRTLGDRYLQRVYTEREIDECSIGHGVDFERLAARFAAKEATLKVLRPGRDEGLSLRCIEVQSDAAGWVGIELTDGAAALAAKAGLAHFELSLTHEGGFASAVVVAEVTRPADT
jgi:holo-[acyl-carrier protein] synthase